MSYVIAVAGKGGSGKTTTAALIVRLLAAKRTKTILAVDADPNSNLAELLGVKIEKTIGEALDRIAANPAGVPQGMSKERFIEYEVQTAITEGDGFDLLTMGKPEGPGCYCYVNNVLRNMMAKLLNDYDYVIIDNEAGLEHLSRRTTRVANALLIISDPTMVGLKAAQRISRLASELRIETKAKLLLINRCEGEVEKEKLSTIDAQYIGSLSFDKDLMALSVKGTPITELKESSVALRELNILGEKIWQRN